MAQKMTRGDAGQPSRAADRRSGCWLPQREKWRVRARSRTSEAVVLGFCRLDDSAPNGMVLVGKLTEKIFWYGGRWWFLVGDTPKKEHGGKSRNRR